jgi:acyl-coenzyme A synthetase/AMP-(fatty) acid ligase
MVRALLLFYLLLIRLSLLFFHLLFRNFTAAPTMHHAILQEAERRPSPLPVESIRYIANAAGGLLPVLAKSLKDTFKATILTSYGMTEW